MSNMQSEPSDDHFQRIDSRSGLSVHKPLINVKIIDPSTTQNEPLEQFDHDNFSMSSVVTGTLGHSNKQSQYSKEPISYLQKTEAILQNIYVEICSTVIASFTIFHPNWFSLATCLVTFIVFIAIPIHMIKTQNLRLKITDVASKIMFVYTFVVIALKLYLVEESYGESFGIYLKTATDEETGLSSQVTDIFATFLFEGVALVTYYIIYKTARNIKIKSLLQSADEPLTYIGCRYFISQRRFFKQSFVIITLIEILNMPDLLALPVLYTFIALMIFALIRVKNVTGQNLRSTFMDSNYFAVPGSKGLVNWAMKDENLFQIMLTWQKSCMMLQLFEFIITHINQVRISIIEGDTHDETHLSTILYLLRCLGHTEYQTAEPMPDIQIAWQMAMTVVIILFGQLCEKTTFLMYSARKNSDPEKDPEFVNRQTKASTTTDSIQKALNIQNIKTSILGFLPIIFNWAVRIAIAIFAYMYNSYVGFYHLFWVMTSFIIPIKIFYTISVVIFFPLVLLEFSLVYVANIKTFNNAHVYTYNLFKQFQFHPINLTLEMCLMYSIVVLVGLMVPARLRFLSYENKHGGSDMTKDMIVKNLKDKNSSVLWKFLFKIIINIHTPVLFLMLFIGNQNFNLFQLGFLFFFVIYGSSSTLYQKTNILLPIFISYFILSQYFWSLVYQNYEGYDKDKDFLFIKDGWEPPADINDFYWSRLPNIQLWGLLYVMQILHSISQWFPDAEQNNKYTEECDKHIFERFPTISKYVKRIWNSLFMLIIVTVLFLLARDLLRQKSNAINLIYLILFTITFGKMCSTSLDGNSYRRCLLFARVIKIYSAIILISLVVYHLLVFEFYNLDSWLQRKRDERSFYVLNIEIFGLGIEPSTTKISVQQYTAYLIVASILGSSFQKSIKQQEKRDLYNWSEALKTPAGVAKTADYFRYDTLFLVYKWFTYWPALDFFCIYFHILNSGIIVYFSVSVSVSIFFAIHLSLIVFFYCYSSFKMHQATYNNTQESVQNKYDLQNATDMCRKYKKLSADLFLKLRQNLWMTQYAITLAFIFAAYLDEIVDRVQKHADDADNPGMVEQLKTLQFYMYWTGINQASNRERLIQGLQPIHIMFLFILLEKQAQNWLYSRWGLNKTLITKFAHLEFYLKIDKKGKDWLPQAQEGQIPPPYIKSQQIMPKHDGLDVLPQLQGERWIMEQFNIYMIFVWRSVKASTFFQAAFEAGIIKKFYKNSNANRNKKIYTQAAFDENDDTMTLKELTILEKELSKKLAIDLDLCSHFQKIKLVIEGEFCVLYLPIKEIVLDQMKKWNLIDLEKVPFLSYSIVSSHRRSIHQKLNNQFLKSALNYNKSYGVDIDDRVNSQKQDYRIRHLQTELMKIVDRRYSYEMWGGMRLLFQQTSLMLLLLNVIIKCNIVSLIYLILVTNYLLRQRKSRAMRNMVYVIGSVLILQYWIYVFNLTSQSSPTPFPEEPYPNKEYPEGKYLIPLMYKLEFGRVMQNAYWYSFGVEIYTIKQLWLDFISLVFVSVYLFYYRNPVLASHSVSFVWCNECKDIGDKKVCQCINQSNLQNKADETFAFNQNETKQVQFCKNLNEYHDLMVLKYPSETEYKNNNERLRELLDKCTYYMIVEGAQILIFTTMHIFTMIVILLMALCRRSLVSIGYVIALAPCLWESANVLKQHENYVKHQHDLKEKQADPDFQKYPLAQQKDILKYIEQKYEWSFIKLICIYLSIYSYLDYLSQVTFQVPYIPDHSVLEHFGLRKIYPTQHLSYDYQAFISGNYDPPLLNMSNLIMQILNCVIVCMISTQAELFKSKGFHSFITEPNKGLDLLMKLSQLKKWAITYDYNNQKLTKILLIQKTEQQIFGTVERLRLNAELWRKSQQRHMLEEYCHKFGGMYIPPNPTPLLKEQKTEEIRNSEVGSESIDLSQSRIEELENLRKDKLVTEQTAFVTSKLLPYRASIYLLLMGLSQSYIFFNRKEEMERIKEEMQSGQQNNGIDLIRIIRSDLFSLLNKLETESGTQLTVWPLIKIEDLRQTNSYCKWPSMISRQISAFFRAIISNTALISYFCMLMSLYTNAGLVALIYPFVVFGYALLEETRPGKTFWRAILAYSLSVLFLKYVVNLNIIHDSSLSITQLPLIDGFLKFGLHHLETTKQLVWHMLPEMLIVMSILCHEIVEQFTGLFEQSESQIEDVPAAIARIFNKNSNNKNTARPKESKMRSPTEVSIVQSNLLENSPEKIQEQIRERTDSLEFQPLLSRASQYVSMDSNYPDLQNKLLQSDLKREQSQEIQQQLTLKLNEIKSVDELSQMEFNQAPFGIDDQQMKSQDQTPIEQAIFAQQSTSQTIDFEISKNSFWNSQYIQRIFPKNQQQKPGTDYYLFQTTVQIYITYYLMNNFTIFSATSPYMENNLFSADMTIVLFYMIFCIILERIIARTENRNRVLKFKQTADAINPRIKPDQLFMPSQHNDLMVKMVIQKLKFQHLADQQHVEALSKLKHQQDCQIIESESLVTKQQKGKFILHWVNMIIVHLFIFWYIPIQANITLYGEPNCSDTPIHGCKDFRVNETLQTFYLWYLLFFYISARQISQGLPSFRRGSSTMYYEGGERNDTEEDIFNAIHQVFINFPLAVEMRNLLDFTFTKTSIDLWQTCELFQYNSDLFIAKTSTLSYNRKVLGKEVSKFSKMIFGYGCTPLMLSFILGPFLMFSSIGGMTLYNPVIANDLQFWVQVNVTSYRTIRDADEVLSSSDSQVVPFKLYESESPSIYDFDEDMFKKRHFNEWPETKFFEPSQIQLIVPTYFSDSTWIASDSQRTFLQKYACLANIQSISDEEVPEGCQIYKNSLDQYNVTVGFQLRTKFKRNGPQSAKDALGMQQRNLNTDDANDRVLLSQFSMMLSEKCTTSEYKRYHMNITNFFYPKILLGETDIVEPIFFDTRDNIDETKRNLFLTYQCRDQWAIGTGASPNEESGSLEFTVLSQKIVTDFLQGYNLGSFYAGIVLLIGMYMRPIFIFNTNRAFIYEINYADPLLRLCESIHLSRARGDLITEEQNFRLLQEILRSPELLKSLTGSCLKGGDYAPTLEENRSHLIPKAYGSQPVP